ncbi:MAG: AAA family ATPase [Deltaproteobacteria bacterium]|jgi:hypothetical protein|nr:AAA family ATPase [Deltaproteobacteria bacterium]
MQTLASSIQSFREIQRERCLYVDKTEYLHRLLLDGRAFCLYRPKGFGKSLLISTIKELFSGDKELFEKLYIHKAGWEFTRNPVISLPLSAFSSDSPQTLSEELAWELKKIADREEVLVRGVRPATLLSYLIQALDIKYRKKVVVLIDDSDEPVTRNIQDPELAFQNSLVLENFFKSLIISRDRIRFAFVTGGYRLKSLNVGDGFFKDISLSPRYAGILGISVSELYNYFKEPLSEILPLIKAESEDFPLDLEALYSELVRWYGGYSWDGEQKLIDPSSLISLLENASFGDYWSWHSFNPALAKILAKDPLILNPDATLSYDRGELEKVIFSPSVPLMYQAGVLSIVKSQTLGGKEFILDYPNLVVERGTVTAALQELTLIESAKLRRYGREFRQKAIEEGPLSLAKILEDFLQELSLASLPGGNKKKLKEVKLAIFSLLFRLAGFKVKCLPNGNLEGQMSVNDKLRLVISLRSIGASSKAPLGMRKRLLSEALNEALNLQAATPIDPGEHLKEFILIVCGKNVLGGTSNRQGSLYFRPLKKAPGE